MEEIETTKKLLKFYFPKLIITPRILLAEHERFKWKRSRLMDDYLAIEKAYMIHKTKITMVSEVNNERRFKGLKPLRRRTWRRLKGS